MEVDCEGCAGCCLDWRPLVDAPTDHERRGPRPPLDDTYNLVPLTREDVRAFVDAGLADALTPRLWTAAEGDDSVTVDGHELAAIGGKPVFFVGLRKIPKPVAPFDTEPRWLRSCAFLDPETLQCRVHDSELYPEECGDYPGHNLALEAEAECERVEDAFGGERLVDDTPPEDAGVLLGPQALGEKVFCYPDADELDGVVARIADGEVTQEDRARFIGVAAASAPATTQIAPGKRETYTERAREADSWVGRAADEWASRAGVLGTREGADPHLGESVEASRGAPATPGWDS
ncbi:YkgJ family cysteine cluster protein [Halarchaeum sp. P4]|uniref:YkgJ family cysteine cluster protein n=1 Tax=Halarchaeum sp. P4 TaxID=3421639 RepID=UPI003EBE2404